MALISTNTKRDNIAQGTQTQRPTGAKGMLRYNTTRKCLEYYDGSWICGVRSHEVHNGACNVSGSNGIVVSGGNFSANQSGNTSKQIKGDVAWLDNRYLHPPNDDAVTAAVCNFRLQDGNALNLQSRNISSVTRVRSGQYTVRMSSGTVTNTKYAVTTNWTGAPKNSDRHVKIYTQNNAAGNLNNWTTSEFDLGVGGDQNLSNNVGLVNLSVVR